MALQEDLVVSTKLKCAAGLAALKDKKYKIAARRFTEVRPFLVQSFTTLHPAWRTNVLVACSRIVERYAPVWQKCFTALGCTEGCMAFLVHRIQY